MTPTPKQNLTKENFWNQLMADYPKGTAVFCEWMDEYKKVNNWAALFNQRHKLIHVHQEVEVRRQIGVAPKFHDLPLAMQVGIFLEFMADITGDDPDAGFEIQNLNHVDWSETFATFIRWLNASVEYQNWRETL